MFPVRYWTVERKQKGRKRDMMGTSMLRGRWRLGWDVSRARWFLEKVRREEQTMQKDGQCKTQSPQHIWLAPGTASRPTTLWGRRCGQIRGWVHKHHEATSTENPLPCCSPFSTIGFLTAASLLTVIYVTLQPTTGRLQFLVFPHDHLEARAVVFAYRVLRSKEAEHMVGNGGPFLQTGRIVESLPLSPICFGFVKAWQCCCPPELGMVAFGFWAKLLGWSNAC